MIHIYSARKLDSTANPCGWAAVVNSPRNPTALTPAW